MLRLLFAFVLALHALIHLLGFAKGFGLARLDQLQVPIGRLGAIAWLAAAALLLCALAAFFVAPQWFWVLSLVGLVVSQGVIVGSWADARFGTLANVALLIATVYGAFAWGPFGLRAKYDRAVREGSASRANPALSSVVTEADLATLPPSVQRYLRFVGVVGRPRPLGFRARMTGRIRGSADGEWMPFEAEQVNFYHPPRRYFFMKAQRGGLPVDGLHAYESSGASMRVHLLSLFPMVSRRGADMARTETVTVLNDMAIFAPAALLDRSIRWREIDESSVEATYSNGPHRIRATLVFDRSGALVDFWSDDRPALAADGRTMVPQRWSTPLREYRQMGPYRLASRGEGRYAPPSGAYTYLELELLEVTTEPLERFDAR